jgi:NADH dehydrogenase/NADH:ubiquinone oxidoreductase subunit G
LVQIALGGIVGGSSLQRRPLSVPKTIPSGYSVLNNIDHRVGLGALLEDETAYTVGVGSGTDLGRVGEDTAILVLGSDLDHEAPVLYLRVATAATRRGAHVINAGGRKDQT